MSMIDVRTKLLCNGTSTPTDAMLAKVAAAGGMAGLGLDCQWDDNTNQYVGDCAAWGIDSSGNKINTKPPITSSPGWATLSDLMKLGLTVAGQAYLNNNQAKIAQYGPNGTVLYQTSAIPNQYINPALSAGAYGGINKSGIGAGAGLAMDTSTLLVIGAGVLALVVVMGRR